MHDPYAFENAFDDLCGDPSEPEYRDRSSTSLTLARRVRAQRLPTPPSDFEVLGADASARTAKTLSYEPRYQTMDIVDTRYQIIGLSYEPHYHHLDVLDTRYQIIGALDDLPILSELKRRFAAALPVPKALRVDDETSYEGFRRERSAPYLAQLVERVAALEAAFASHIADGHGDAVVGALAEAVVGGTPIAVGPHLTGKVECWQDGREVLLTARALGPDGRLKIVTTGAPVAQALDEVLGCCLLGGEDEDDVEDLMSAVPEIARANAGERLLVEVCCALPVALRHPPGTVLGMKPKASPTLAATMALLQRCSRGDKQACHELAQLPRALVDKAVKQLKMAQRARRN